MRSFVHVKALNRNPCRESQRDRVEKSNAQPQPGPPFATMLWYHAIHFEKTSKLILGNMLNSSNPEKKWDWRPHIHKRRGQNVVRLESTSLAKVLSFPDSAVRHTFKNTVSRSTCRSSRRPGIPREPRKVRCNIQFLLEYGTFDSSGRARTQPVIVWNSRNTAFLS